MLSGLNLIYVLKMFMWIYTFYVLNGNILEYDFSVKWQICKRAYVPEQTEAKKGEAMMRHTCAAAWETFCAEGVGSHHHRLKAADENEK